MFVRAMKQPFSWAENIKNISFQESIFSVGLDYFMKKKNIQKERKVY